VTRKLVLRVPRCWFRYPERRVIPMVTDRWPPRRFLRSSSAISGWMSEPLCHKRFHRLSPLRYGKQATTPLQRCGVIGNSRHGRRSLPDARTVEQATLEGLQRPSPSRNQD
jgi:hypothetical protein